MEKSSQIAWKIVPLRHFFPLKVVPLIEVLLYPLFLIGESCGCETLSSLGKRGGEMKVKDGKGVKNQRMYSELGLEMPPLHLEPHVLDEMNSTPTSLPLQGSFTRVGWPFTQRFNSLNYKSEGLLTVIVADRGLKTVSDQMRGGVGWGLMASARCTLIPQQQNTPQA
jgi:hypothetical protein